MSRRIPAGRFGRLLSLTTLLAAVSGPVFADIVYLKHGGRFEDVVAALDGDRYRIQMEGGEILLPTSQVERLESAPSPLGEFLSRRAALPREAVRAADWLALARFALDHGLRHSAREAALVAAGLAPELDGLPAVLARFGYQRQPGSGEWVRERTTTQAALEPQPSPAPRAPDRRAEIEALAHREIELARQRQALEAARLAREIAQERQAAAPAPVPAYPVVAYALPLPIIVIPGFPLPPAPPVAPAPNGPRPGDRTSGTLNIYDRQPGSLIPAGGSYDRP